MKITISTSRNEKYRGFRAASQFLLRWSKPTYAATKAKVHVLATYTHLIGLHESRCCMLFAIREYVWCAQNGWLVSSPLFADMSEANEVEANMSALPPACLVLAVAARRKLR